MNTLSRDDFVQSVARIAESVYDFHQRFDDGSRKPAPSPEDYLATLRERLPLLVEEMGEMAQGMNKGNLDEAADELADVAFVVMGTILALDCTGTGACYTVADKNDRKTTETHVVEETSGKLVRRSRAT